ncbi:MAG: extracellular solute-binding protein, partial [Methylocystaceae bacterium]|nr:extracellular solute-binding protein [Methylocystaceae bacterium]
MTMKRRTFMKLAGSAAAATGLAAPAIGQSATTVRWWYHYDNPQSTPQALIEKFESANKDIKIQAEAIPWGGGTDYVNRVFSSVVAGNQPDCAMVRLSYLSRFQQMKALEPLDSYLTGWAGRSDISEDVWKINRAPDGKSYYMPLHYVVIYLYYRQDLFQQAGLQAPKTHA